MDTQYAIVSAFLLIHIFSMLGLSASITSAIGEFHRSKSIERETKEIIASSLVLSATFVSFAIAVLINAGDEIISFLIVTMIIDLIVCTLGVKLES